MTSASQTLPATARVTVILTAYNRRQYLREALDSVLRQSLRATEFEVLVLTNFDCAELAVPGRVRIVPDDSPRVGQTLAHGLREARGRIVTFLDDDDLYHPDRLERVLRAFDAIPGLAFYHNGYSLFSGRPAAPVGSTAAAQDALVQGRAEGSRDGSHEFLRFLSVRNRERNLSSSAILRDVGQQFLPYVERIEGHTDTFLLFVGLASHGLLAFDSAQWTQVRRHPTNTSSSEQDLTKRRDAWSAIQDMVHASHPGGALEGYLALRQARSLIYEHLAGEPVTRPEIWSATRTVLREHDISGWSNSLIDSALGIGGLASLPGLAPAARFAMG